MPSKKQIEKAFDEAKDEVLNWEDAEMTVRIHGVYGVLRMIKEKLVANLLSTQKKSR